MPIVPYDDTVPQSYMAPGRAPVASDFEGSVWAAAFGRENPVAAAWAYMTAPQFEDDPLFDLEAMAKQHPAEVLRHEKYFLGVRSEAEFLHVLEKVREVDRQDAVLERAGAAGLGARFIAGLASPTILLPGGAIARGGQAALKSAASVGAWAAAGEAIDQGVLYTNNPEITASDAAIGVATATVMGGLIGAGASRLLTRAETRAFEAGMVSPATEQTIQPYGMGAQVNLDPTRALDVTTDAGGTFRVGLDRATTFLSPVTRNLNQAYSSTLRAVQAKLSTGGMYLEGNLNNIASAPGGEVLALRNLHYRKLAAVKEVEKVAWKEYLTATTRSQRLNRKQFDQEVGKALERAGEHDIPQVSKIAKAYQNEFFLPFLREAKAVGMKGFAEIDDAEALRYMPRILRQGMVQADEKALIDILAEHLNEKMMQGFITRYEKMQDYVKAEEQALAEIGMTPEAAKARYADLEIQMAKLPEQFPEVTDVANEIRAKRAEARGKSTPEAKALRAEANALEEANAERLADFKKAEKKLKASFRNLTLTRSAFEKRYEQTLDRITAVEDQQLDSVKTALNRAHRLLSQYEAGADLDLEKAAQLRAQVESAWEVLLRGQERLDKLNDLPEGFQQIVDSDVRPTEKISILEARQADRMAALEQQLAKLGDLESEVPEVRAAAVQSAIDDLTYATIRITNKRTERIKKLWDRAQELKPAKQAEMLNARQKALKEKQEAWLGKQRERYEADVKSAEGVRKLNTRDSLADLPKVVSFDRAARQQAIDIHAKMTGEAGRIPALAMLSERGPELARTLDIDPTRVWSNGRTYEEFLERDIEKVGRRYMRTMASDIELQRAFGSVNPLAKDAPYMKAIKKEFDEAKDAVDADEKLSPEQKAKKRAKIQAAFEQAIDDLEGQIERLRFQRGVPEDPNGIAFRAGKSLMNITYMANMGGVVLSSIPDFGGLVLRNGLLNTFRHGFLPMITDLKTFKMSAAEAKHAGVALDLALGTRAAAMHDVFDELEHGTGLERGIQWASNNYGYYTLFDGYNTGVKSIAAAMINARMMKGLQDAAEGKLGKAEAAYLASNGIDERTAQMMWKEISLTPGAAVNRNGVYVPNTMNWGSAARKAAAETNDPKLRMKYELEAQQATDLARAYQAAIGRQADAWIVTPGLERPLWMDKNIFFRMVAQFRSFTYASHQKTLLAAMQEAKIGYKHDIGNMANVISGVTTMLALGALSYYAYANIRGGDTLKKMQKATPAEWAFQAVARSGLLGIFAEVQNQAMNVPAFRGVASLGTDTDTRPFFADPLVKALGPNIETGRDIMKAAGLAGADAGKRVESLRDLMPLQNFTALGWAFDAIEEFGKDFVGAN